jgi:hypothetical protein
MAFIDKIRGGLVAFLDIPEIQTVIAKKGRVKSTLREVLVLALESLDKESHCREKNSRLLFMSLSIF